MREDLFYSGPSGQQIGSNGGIPVNRPTPAPPAGERDDRFGSLPLSLGSVHRIVSGPHGAPVVFHIQDVHQNDEAQRAIAGVVRSLAPSAGVIALEGAVGPIDLSLWRSHANKKALGWASDYLFKQKSISGPVYAVLQSTGPMPPLLGVDDPIHYAANVRTYRQAAEQREALTNQWRQAREVLNGKKASVYNHSLQSLDKHVIGRQNQTVSFGDYIHAIVNANPEAARKKGQITLLLKVLNLEKEMDFEEVENQRARLVQKLLDVMDKKGAERLARQALSYRLGETGYADFYRELKHLCKVGGVDLSEYPALDRYLHYVALSEGIRVRELFRQVTDQEKDAYARLARSLKERELVVEDRQNNLTGKLLDFSLTPEEWADYRPTPGLKDFENFYREAQARNETMARGVLQALKTQKSSFALLVTGGFHSAGMEKIFQKAGVTVVGFTPRIEKLENSPDYLSVFTREKTPLEVLFEGNKLFLAQPPVRESIIRVLGPALVVLAAALLGEGGQLFDPSTAYAAMGGLGILSVAPSTDGLAATVVMDKKNNLVLEAKAGSNGF